MITFKKFFKSIGILNSVDQTKELEITVSDSQTSGAKVTLVSNATADRTITLPDGDGTLAFGNVILTPSRAVVTDGSGNLAVSAVTSTEVTSLIGITGNIETRLDAAESDIDDLEADVASLTSDVSDLNTNALLKDGTIPLNNNTALSGRNAANNNNIPVAIVSATDIVQFSSTSFDSHLRGQNVQVVAPGLITISSSAANLQIDAATAISFGGTAPGISAGTKTIGDVVDPVDPQDAATKAYVDANAGSTDPHPARRTQTIDKSIASGGGVQLDYNTSTFDPETLTTGTPFSYTAPETGYYMVSASASFAATTAFDVGEQIVLNVRVGGSAVATLGMYISELTGVNAVRRVGGSALISASATDVIDIIVTQTSGSAITQNGLSSPNSNYVTIHYVGA